MSALPGLCGPQTLAEHSGSPTPTLLGGPHGLGDVQRPAEAGPAGWGVLWGHCGPSAAFARGSSNLWLQVWEADGDIYWLSWLIICPARRPGELFGGSGELGEAVSDQGAEACFVGAAAAIFSTALARSKAHTHTHTHTHICICSRPWVVSGGGNERTYMRYCS